MGCHFLLQCMKVISESEVAQLCPTLSDRMDFSLPGSSIRGIFQAGVLECVAIVFSGRIMLMVTFSPVVSPLPGGALKPVCKADMSFIYGVIDSRSDSPSPSRQREALELESKSPCSTSSSLFHVCPKGQGDFAIGSQAGQRPRRNDVHVYSGGSPFHRQILANPWLRSGRDVES